jgi:hypothetical protein
MGRFRRIFAQQMQRELAEQAEDLGDRFYGAQENHCKYWLSNLLKGKQQNAHLTIIKQEEHGPGVRGK